MRPYSPILLIIIQPEENGLEAVVEGEVPYTDSDHTGNGGIRKAASKKYCERRGDQSIYEHGGYWTILWQRFDLPDFLIDRFHIRKSGTHPSG